MAESSRKSSTAEKKTNYTRKTSGTPAQAGKKVNNTNQTSKSRASGGDAQTRQSKPANTNVRANTGTRTGQSVRKSSTGTSRRNSGRKRKSGINNDAIRDTLLFITIAISLIFEISNFGVAGKIGHVLECLQFGTFGVLAYIFPLWLLIGSVFAICHKNVSGVARVKFFSSFVGAIFLCGFLEMIFGNYKTVEKLSAYYRFDIPLKKSGGFIGGGLCKLLTPAFGEVGAYIIFVVFIIVAVVLITEMSFFSEIKNGSRRVIDTARNDINEYREETQKKREIRQENKAHEDRIAERKKRFSKVVSGVNMSIDIPENPDYIEADSGKEEITDKKRKHNELSSEDVKEVFQNERYSEDIIDIVSDSTDHFSHEDEHENEESLVDFEFSKPKKLKQESIETENEEDDLDLLIEDESLEEYEEPEEAFARPAAEYEAFSGNEAKHGFEGKPDYDTHERKRNSVSEAKPAAKPASISAASSVSSSSALEEKKKENINTEYEEDYKFPPIELLSKGQSVKGTSEKELHDTSIKLQQTLANFGVKVTITDVSCGPTVTRYELLPELGVKVSKIVSLADDIKLNLAAADIRIEAPIPGKAAVGIEVPNKQNVGVSLREIIESTAFRQAASSIAFGAGKDIAGQVVVADIAKMPHVLIAGATGSGKSVCINTIIMSILYRAKPSDVKLIMIDPKVVELSVYNDIPHLLIPVVTDPKKAAGALAWAVAEMDDRYKKFSAYGVRDLKGFNAKVDKLKDSGTSDEEIPARLPQMVIIIDELADLMMCSKNEVETSIARLAQLARAAGIHLVIATQRPSVDVITGTIKSNVPSRIAFAVSSGVDSRTILDMVGAEKLLGKGDMLFAPAGYPKPVRVQGAFVSDNEVSAVVDFIKENCGHKGGYHADVAERINNPAFADSQAFGGDRDEYFAQAGKYLIEKGKGSIGVLQRVYRIGFNRAARIMDQLEENGVVGPEEGTKPRKVLMTMEEFEELIK